MCACVWLTFFLSLSLTRYKVRSLQKNRDDDDDGAGGKNMRDDTVGIDNKKTFKVVILSGFLFPPPLPPHSAAANKLKIESYASLLGSRRRQRTERSSNSAHK